MNGCSTDEISALHRQLLEKIVESDRLNVDLNSMRLDIDRLAKECNEATTPIYEELSKVTAPFDRKQRELRTAVNDIVAKLPKIVEEVAQLKARIKMTENANAGEFLNAEDFSDFLRCSGVVMKTSKIEQAYVKDVGVCRMFRAYDVYENGASDSEWVSYFATHKRAVVGYFHIKKSRHAGDSSQHRSWLNVREMNSKNTLTVTTERGYQRQMMFGEWKDLVRSMTSNKLTAIDSTNHSNRVTFGSRLYCHYKTAGN